LALRQLALGVGAQGGELRLREGDELLGPAVQRLAGQCLELLTGSFVGLLGGVQRLGRRLALML